MVLKLGKEKFYAIGLLPTRRRGLQFLVGFLPAAFIAMIYFVLMIWILEAEVVVNDAYSILQFSEGFGWTLRSVLFEELLFRGALLFLAIKYFGAVRGILLSSCIFGIYHWFSYNILGDITPMIYTFIITGIGGAAFAYAYIKTHSLYLPVGLHFGWNLITIAVFSQGPLGEQLLITSTENSLGVWWSLFSFLYQITLLPLITFLCIRFLGKTTNIKLADDFSTKAFKLGKS